MDKVNQNRHHRHSIRLQNYDYSCEGLYFITLCTEERKCLFGNIVDGEIVLSDMGKIVREEWENSANIRKEVEIHSYVVMPNHFHAIVEIIGHDTGDVSLTPLQNTQTNNSSIPTEETVGAYGLRPPLQSPSRTLGALIRGFKSSVTKRLSFSLWQRNYYEHVIRNNTDYMEIEEYIINNPFGWGKDPLNEGI